MTTVVAAAELEDRAGRGELDGEVAGLVARLAALGPELLGRMAGISVAALRAQS